MEAEILRVAGWEQYPWLKAGFSVRAGGCSVVYAQRSTGNAGERRGEQNLGFTREDDASFVEQNRAVFAEAVWGGRPGALRTLRQVHGTVVRSYETTQETEGGAMPEGDGWVTRDDGVLLGIQTADCVPILLADQRRRVVAALHAGWRGTLAGIAGIAVQKMRAEYGCDGAEIVAAVGPAIGGCCFEVGEEVVQAFDERFPYAGDLVRREGVSKPHIDLREANRRQLLEAGLRAEAVTMVGECTACTRLDDGRRKYFSYRAEHGVTGRLMSAIGIVPGSAVAA